MKIFSIVAVALTPTFVFAADSLDKTTERIQHAARVFHEIMSAPDRGIPRDILEKAQCVGIIPGEKTAGFVVGAKYGKGVLVCRDEHGQGWGAPDTVIVEGGSVGFQIGAGETDAVFVVKNRDGERKLMQDKFTFDASGGAMAGPVGRSGTAQTDAQLHAEILSWSRSRGAFAGVDLGGATLRTDHDANRALYGRDVTASQILHGAVPPPLAAKPLYSELNVYAPTPRVAHR